MQNDSTPNKEEQLKWYEFKHEGILYVIERNNDNNISEAEKSRVSNVIKKNHSVLVENFKKCDTPIIFIKFSNDDASLTEIEKISCACVGQMTPLTWNKDYIESLGIKDIFQIILPGVQNDDTKDQTKNDNGTSENNTLKEPMHGGSSNGTKQQDNNDNDDDYQSFISSCISIITKPFVVVFSFMYDVLSWIFGFDNNEDEFSTSHNGDAMVNEVEISDPPPTPEADN